ncbi:hypothetical protein TNCV_4936771 [Trichonephila clavipes]|nr:hypothetical protein TNCV_4936771 [Trichonephila clavipes]
MNSTTTQKHFIDDWSNLINPEKLPDKLDAYENVREGTKLQQSPANDGIWPQEVILEILLIVNLSQE